MHRIAAIVLPFLTALTACFCVLAVLPHDSFAHRIQEYERWSLDQLCAGALDASLDLSQREKYLSELGKRFGTEEKTIATFMTIIQDSEEAYFLRDTSMRHINLKGPEGDKNAKQLLELSRSAEKNFPRLEALRTLARQRGDIAEVKALLFQLAKDRSEDSILRRNVVYFLGKYFADNQDAFALLKNRFTQRDEDPHVRYNAAAAFAKHHEKNREVLSLLQATVSDETENPFVRRQIIWCFGQFLSEKDALADFVYQVAMDEDNPLHLRDVAIQTLVAEFEDHDRGLPLALQMARNPDRTQGPRLAVLRYFQHEFPFNYTRKFIPLYLEISGNRSDDDTIRKSAIQGLIYNDEKSEAYLGLKTISLDPGDSVAVRVEALKKISRPLAKDGDALSVVKKIAMDPEEEIELRLQSLFSLTYNTKDSARVPELLNSIIEYDKEAEKVRAKALFRKTGKA